MKGAAKVVGTASSPEKCARVVTEYGADACIDYRNTSDLQADLRKEFPDGIDVYFDNVGGEILEAALATLARNARVAVCGMIAQYNNTDGGAPVTNLFNLLIHEAVMEGFLITSFFGTEACAKAFVEMGEWLNSGKLNAIVDKREMFDDIANAYNLLFTGKKMGRLVVTVPD